MVERSVGFNRLCHIVPDKPKAGVTREVAQVPFMTGKEIVQPYDRVVLSDQSVAHVGADKPGGPGNQDSQQLHFTSLGHRYKW
jgi:hypothetical protein